MRKKKLYKDDEYIYSIIYKKPSVYYGIEASVRFAKTPITQMDAYWHWAEVTMSYPVDRLNTQSRYLHDNVLDTWTRVKYGEVFYTADAELFEEAKKEVSEKIRVDYERLKYLYESIRRLLTSAGTLQVEYEVNEKYFEDEEDYIPSTDNKKN